MQQNVFDALNTGCKPDFVIRLPRIQQRCHTNVLAFGYCGADSLQVPKLPMQLPLGGWTSTGLKLEHTDCQYAIVNYICHAKGHWFTGTASH